MFRLRRKHSKSGTLLELDGQNDQLLLRQVRDQLAVVAAYRDESQWLAEAIRDRLRQLDGLAQQVALNGLLQEGINILVIQHGLAQQLSRIDSELHEAAIVERRLRAAEQRLSPETQADQRPNTFTATDAAPVQSLADVAVQLASEPARVHFEAQPARLTMLGD
jgi:hypothetical protein